MSKLMNKCVISMGDPKGVGPEIVAAVVSDAALTSRVAVTIFGDPAILSAAAVAMKRPPISEWQCEIVAVSNDPHWRDWDDAMCGRMGRDYVARAVEFCQTSGAALVTAPINKHRWELACGEAHGHTEFLAQLTRSPRVGMMMAGPKLRTVPVTIHTPLSQVASELSLEKIIVQTELTHHFLQKHFKISAPRIAMTGLNPHAGDQGTLGPEEASIIVPAIEALARKGIAVKGPLPADGLFAKIAMLPPIFDVVICMYHDQALIPAKMLDYRNTVNVTMGLPFIRTSPDHGTAEDIAWQGRVDPHHMRAAVEMAIQLSPPPPGEG